MNLETYLSEKLKNFTEQIAQELDKELETIYYETGFEGRVTYRSNGEVVEAERNIVDTGNLRDNKEVTKVSNLQYTIDYNSEYAAEVYFVDGGGRPWVERFVGKLDKTEIRKLFKNS